MEPVELISNLAWVVVVVAVCAIWLRCQRGGRGKSLLPALGIQLVSLAVLSAILLPVISVTDDLHAFDLPAEVARSCNWDHRQFAAMQALHQTPAVEVPSISGSQPASLKTVAFLNTDETPAGPRTLHCVAVSSRPPPSA